MVKIKKNAVEWNVPHYAPSIRGQNIIMNQTIKKMATELRYPVRSVFMKENITQKFSTFELGTQEGFNIPIWIFTIFRQSDKEHDQNLTDDTFVRLPIVSAQVIIGTEKYPDSGFLLKYVGDDSSQGYGQAKEAFRALRQDNVLDQYISEADFRSSNDGNDVCYNVNSFDIRYQKKFENAQPVNVVFEFLENVPVGLYGYSLFLTNRLVSIKSDGQQMFDLA